MPDSTEGRAKAEQNCKEACGGHPEGLAPRASVQFVQGQASGIGFEYGRVNLNERGEKTEQKDARVLFPPEPS